jgi:nucleoid DNA-binding protein
MRKVEMARRIAEATGLSQVKSEEAIDAVLEEIKSTLQQGDSV